MGADIGPPQTTSPATFASRAISSRRATIARYTPRPRNLARTAPPLMIAPTGGYRVRPALPAGSPANVGRMARLFPAASWFALRRSRALPVRDEDSKASQLTDAAALKA